MLTYGRLLLVRRAGEHHVRLGRAGVAVVSLVHDERLRRLKSSAPIEYTNEGSTIPPGGGGRARSPSQRATVPPRRAARGTRSSVDDARGVRERVDSFNSPSRSATKQRRADDDQRASAALSFAENGCLSLTTSSMVFAERPTDSGIREVAVRADGRHARPAGDVGAAETR